MQRTRFAKNHSCLPCKAGGPGSPRTARHWQWFLWVLLEFSSLRAHLVFLTILLPTPWPACEQILMLCYEKGCISQHCT